jgi:hypothetical protein
LVVGFVVPVVLLTSHAYRRSQARQQQEVLLAQEQAEITLRLEGLLYSATKRARDCRVDEAADYRRRAQELNAQIAAQRIAPPPGWSIQLAELSTLLAECDAAARAEEEAIAARERSRLATLARLEQAFALHAAAYDFAGMEANIADLANHFPDAGEMVDGWRAALKARRAEWDQWATRVVRWSNATRESWYILLENLLPCSLCAGSGEEPCPHCKGTLYVDIQRPCPKTGCVAGKTRCFSCGGAGFINCSECGGSGSVEMVRYVSSGGTLSWPQTYSVRCTLCNGSRGKSCSRCGGKKGSLIICDECKGTGVVQRHVRCPDCKSGKIPCHSCSGDGHWRRS